MSEAKKSGPLYLTEYLANGWIKEAQEKSRVLLPHSSVDIESHSGYITVNKDRGDHLFFWYFPREQKCVNKYGEESPLVIWLNGGPGYSSLLGLFEEIGPFVVDENNKVSKREFTWTDHFSLLGIDNPVGAGFSYRETSYEESMSSSDIADNLYQCVVQFFEIFPEVKTKDVYIGGQSYAGKYVPSLAYRIQAAGKSDIRLKGIYIASGLTSPKKMLPQSHKSLVDLGVMSKHSGELMKASILKAMEEIKSNPKKGMENILGSIFGNMQKVKGYANVDNMISTQEILQPHLISSRQALDASGRLIQYGVNGESFSFRFQPRSSGHGTVGLAVRDYNWTFASYVNLPEVQQALHAKPCDFQIINDDTVMQMASDFLSGTSHEMSVLLENYRVLLFNGQMDPVVSVSMTDAFLCDLQWFGREEYAQSVKTHWKDADGTVAGYAATVKNLTWIIVPLAGHRTAIDQPKQVLDMMKQFIQGAPF